MKKLFCLTVLSVLSFGFASAQNMEDVKDARQAMFKVIGWEMGILAGMAKGETPFDAQKAEVAAKSMNAVANSLHGVFLEGSFANSMVSPEVLQKQDEFNGDLAALIDASNDMISASATEEGLKVNLGKIGASCKSCHTAFRLE